MRDEFRPPAPAGYVAGERFSQRSRQTSYLTVLVGSYGSGKTSPVVAERYETGQFQAATQPFPAVGAATAGTAPVKAADGAE